MTDVNCKSKTICGLSLLFLLAVIPAFASEQNSDASSLAGAFLTDTPLIEDLRVLSDEIGGRITGSAANEKAIEWAIQRFRHIGLSVKKEPFSMVKRWLPKTASVTIEGDDLSFSPRVVAYEGPYKEYKENDPYYKGVFIHSRMRMEFWKDRERDLWIE